MHTISHLHIHNYMKTVELLHLSLNLDRLIIREYIIYLYIICILVWHPDDGHWCICNMLGNSSVWL